MQSTQYTNVPAVKRRVYKGCGDEVHFIDEATASLDVENETLIQASLSQLMKNKTVLLIAHRMRTVAGADQIIVLKNGHVAENGSPETLMEENGIFAHMSRLQTEAASWSIQ